jgi:hypothetical protein
MLLRDKSSSLYSSPSDDYAQDLSGNCDRIQLGLTNNVLRRFPDTIYSIAFFFISFLSLRERNSITKRI